MSTQLVTQPDFNMDVALRDIDGIQAVCMKLMQTKHYARMGEEGIFAIVQKAKSLKIDPIDALGGALYYVQGKVGMSSETMASLIRQAGHSIIKDSKSDNSTCILHGKRIDNGDTWTCTFSMEDARRAGLAKNMYDKYPSVMLYNRCMSMLARQLFPDIIKGSGYTMDELMEIKNNNHREESIQSGRTLDIQPEVKPDIISDEQAAELLERLKKCSIDFQGEIVTFCRRSRIGEDLKGLPRAFYDRLSNKVNMEIENLKIYQEELVKNDEDIIE